MLPANEDEWLRERWPDHTVQVDAGMICILIPDFPLGGGFDRPAADLLLRLSAGYPDIAPDMWWFDPQVRRLDGASIPATDCTEVHLGRTWQRWSRHLQPGQWRSGVDSLQSFLALTRKELETAALGLAA